MTDIRIKYDKGQLVMDLHSILEQVEPEQKREMLESLSCDSEILEFVTQQIIDKWTENGYAGSYSCEAPLHPFGLDKAWRMVAKASGEVARKQIEGLESRLARETEENHKLRLENSDLRRGVYR